MRNLFLLSFVLFTSISEAQYIVTEVPKFEVGLVGGFNLTKVQGSNDFTFARRRIGGSAGVNFIYNFSRSVGINTELLFEQKGWNDFSNHYGPTDTINYEAQLYVPYLSLPVLGKFQIGESRHFTLEAGVQPSFRVGKANWNEEDGLNTDVTEKIKPFDLGLVLGFGTKFAIKEKGNVYLKIRQHFGVLGSNNFSTRDGKSAVINSYQVLVGYSWYIK